LEVRGGERCVGEEWAEGLALVGGVGDSLPLVLALEGGRDFAWGSLINMLRSTSRPPQKKGHLPCPWLLRLELRAVCMPRGLWTQFSLD